MRSRSYYRDDGRTPIFRGALSYAFVPSERPANPTRLYWAFALGALLLAVPGSASPCLGQSAQPLTLDEVVARLQNNLDSYKRSIPSFLADEHIDSSARHFGNSVNTGTTVRPVGSGLPGTTGVSDVVDTIAESVFRLKRDVDPERHIPMLDESREIKTIDGKPANGRDIDASYTFSGAFSGGLALVSKDQQACMRYTLVPPKPGKPIIVSFASAPAGQRPRDCVLADDGSGRVTIDPTSMQITKIEIKVPHHVITPRDKDGHTGPPIVTSWEIQVAYKPVVLDANTFWLPATISSVSSAERDAWSFVATYRNYHLLQVRSRILVPTDAATQ